MAKEKERLHSADPLIEADPDEMQEPDVIQAAHNLLLGIILEEFPCPEGEDKERLVHYGQVLCWVLGHAHRSDAAQDFEDTLLRLTDHVLNGTGRKLLDRVQRHRVN